MAKTEVGIQFTLPSNEILTEYTVNVIHRMREAFVLDHLHRGDISANRAARLLNVSPEDLSEFMYKIKPEPPLLTTVSPQRR